jgi:hypothetical protein
MLRNSKSDIEISSSALAGGPAPPVRARFGPSTGFLNLRSEMRQPGTAYCSNRGDLMLDPLAWELPS